LNEKPKLILPHNEDGIANLEIRRMQAELEKKDKPVEMIGYMPVQVAETATRYMRKAIKEIERGEVSSCCILMIKPKKNGRDVAECSMNVKQEEVFKIDELFHMSLVEVLPPPPTEPEAG